MCGAGLKKNPPHPSLSAQLRAHFVTDETGSPSYVVLRMLSDKYANAVVPQIAFLGDGCFLEQAVGKGVGELDVAVEVGGTVEQIKQVRSYCWNMELGSAVNPSWVEFLGKRSQRWAE